MLEGSMRKSIKRYMPGYVYSHSNTGASMAINGVPDDYFDGPAGDLWVESKVIRAMPRSGIVVGDYSALQLHWMKRRYGYGVQVPNVVGIVGLPNRTAVIQRHPHEWEGGSPITESLTLKEVADWISQVCSDSSARLELLRPTWRL